MGLLLWCAQKVMSRWAAPSLGGEPLWRPIQPYKLSKSAASGNVLLPYDEAVY
jgi:hypothetical protein